MITIFSIEKSLNYWNSEGTVMNKYFILSIICLIVGALLLGLGISEGQGKVYWVVIFPVIEGTGVFSFLGVLLIIIGIVLLMVSFVSGSIEWVGFDDLELDRPEPYPTTDPHPRQPYKKPKRYRDKRDYERKPPRDFERRPKKRTSDKTGGMVFIGPLPIIWGSDRKITYIMALVSVVLVIILLIYTVSLFW